MELDAECSYARKNYWPLSSQEQKRYLPLTTDSTEVVKIKETKIKL